jgi:hypothetical protein
MEKLRNTKKPRAFNNGKNAVDNELIDLKDVNINPHNYSAKFVNCDALIVYYKDMFKVLLRQFSSE